MEKQIRERVRGLKETLRRLGAERSEMEKKLMESYKVLTTPTAQYPRPPGLKGNLVDSEGFPRSDIDIHAIRIIRNERARMQTDHKIVMKQIEENLHKLHSEMAHLRAMGVAEDTVSGKGRGNRATTEGASTKSSESATKSAATLIAEYRPFAEVKSVATDSPSYEAGMLVGDLIVRVGTINTSNHRNLQAVGELVQSSINRAINVVVMRRHSESSVSETTFELKTISLTPKRWRGAGLLGCHIVEYSDA
eukprot:g898.t1